MTRTTRIALSIAAVLVITTQASQVEAQKDLPPSTPAAGEMVGLQSAPRTASTPPVQTPPTTQPRSAAPNEQPWQAPVRTGEPWVAPRVASPPAPGQPQGVQRAQPAQQPQPHPSRYAQTPEFVETPPEQPVEIEEGLASRYVDQYLVAPQNTFGVGLPLTGIIIPEANPSAAFGGEISIVRSFSDYFQLTLNWNRFALAPEASTDIAYGMLRGDIRAMSGEFELDIAPYVGVTSMVLVGGAQVHMRWHNGDSLLDIAPYIHLQHGFLQEVAETGIGVNVSSAFQLSDGVAIEVRTKIATGNLDLPNATVSFEAALPMRARSSRVEFAVRPRIGFPYLLSPLTETPFDVVTLGLDFQLRFLPAL